MRMQQLMLQLMLVQLMLLLQHLRRSSEMHRASLLSLLLSQPLVRPLQLVSKSGDLDVLLRNTRL